MRQSVDARVLVAYTVVVVCAACVGCRVVGDDEVCVCVRMFPAYVGRFWTFFLVPLIMSSCRSEGRLRVREGQVVGLGGDRGSGREWAL